MIALAFLALLDIPTPLYELIVVSGEGCLPCKQMAPIVRRIEQEGAIVYHVDFERDNATARAWRVDVMPTIIVLEDRKEKKRFVGLTAYETIKAAMPLFTRPRPATDPIVRTAPKDTLPVPHSIDIVPGPTTPFDYGKVLGAFLLPPQLSIPLAFAAPIKERLIPIPSDPKTGLPLQKEKIDVGALALACHVRITVTTSRGSISWGSGTIFLYDADYTEIVTNKHVVSSGGTITIDDGTDYWSGVKCWERWPGKGYVFESRDDIAVIRAEKRPPASVALCDINYEPKEPIYMVGSPLGGDPVVCQVKIVNRWNEPSGAQHFSLDKQTISGDSGGGLIDSEGILFGVNWGYETGGNGFAVDLTRSRSMGETTRKKSQKSAAGTK